MGLEIHSVRAQIGISQIRPVQSIRQPQGELSIRQVKAEMSIDRELPKVLIDQSQCFAEAGLKNSAALTRENAELGMQTALEYTGRIAEEGDQMARIEDGRRAGAVVADLAEANAWPETDFNIDFIPKSRPRIEVTGHLNINWQIGKAIVDYKPNPPVIDYQPGKVEIYLRQQGSIEMHYVDTRA